MVIFDRLYVVRRITHKKTSVRVKTTKTYICSPCTVSLAGLLFLVMFSKGLCVTQMYNPSSSNVTLKRCRVPEVFFWLPPPYSP